MSFRSTPHTNSLLNVQLLLFRFEALLYYMYTGEIYFAPFGSEANRSYRASEKPNWEMDNPPKVSPKSIYRLADKVAVSVLLIHSTQLV